MSRRKLAVSDAASAAVSGGTRRVFTWFGRGALAITAMAQVLGEAHMPLNQL